MTMNASEQALDAIRRRLGPKGWISDRHDMAPYLEEQRGLYHGDCALVARPSTAAETAEVVRLCAGAKIPVTPQGGNTGLVGGGVPRGGIILSTDRLNRIRNLDIVNHAITVEAGCILADIQAAAAAAGALFPLSLAAEGSCRIGGNISTNAGGVAVLRYGSMRELVLGLEVALPDGRLWNGLRALRKDNAGYDLKHLFIGAEGTLGVITAAVLKLFPRPKARETALAALPTYEAALELFVRMRDQAGDSLTAFEVMCKTSVQLAFRHMPGCVDPFAERHPLYVLVELCGAAPRPALEEALAEAIKDGVVVDAVIASSESQSADLWRIRESIAEAQKREGASIKHDISAPISRLPEFFRRAVPMVEGELEGVRVVAFGHLGDGNIHFNLSRPEAADDREFLSHRKRLNRLVYDLVMEMNGSFSAEHGVGMLKTDDLERFKSETELDLMRTLKKALDPDNIMNPGKVILFD